MIPLEGRRDPVWDVRSAQRRPRDRGPGDFGVSGVRLRNGLFCGQGHLCYSNLAPTGKLLQL